MKMEVLQRPQNSLALSLVPDISPTLSGSDVVVPVNLSITATEEERANLLVSILSESTTPLISLQTNEFRGGPDATSKETFRRTLLGALRKGWNDAATEARFIRMVNVLQQDGCAIFAGLVDVSSFRQLIDDFTNIMNGTGSHAFLHSFAHLIAHPDFVKNPGYSDAFIHPLLISLMAYAMGGPVRMTDARGKDTQPISVNAQDNMLHVDNTPFREEYKILLGWEKGEVKGPTGQNFTFLPATHKGNRLIRTDGQSQPWSSENDSLLITDESITGVLNFQRDITGRTPRVVEVEYPDQPVTVLFNAGSLVHHRYRNNNGNARSCVITAFHLASDHPGALVGSETDAKPLSLSDILMGYQNGSEAETFCSLLGVQAASIESKIAEILDEGHHSTLVDTTGLTLSGQKFDSWRKTVINAPSATQLKFEAGNFISFADDSTPRELLVHKLAAAMSYDKHGLLDLIIYADGHEEIRKPARKSIWTMPRERIAQVLTAWLPAVEGYKFSTADVQKPDILQYKAHKVARLIRESFPTVDFARESTDREEQQLTSAHQLIVDLGESVTRCEKVETYITTNLFLFLMIDQVIPSLDWALRHRVIADCAVFLRAYISSVLVVEKNYGI
ncbi:hypothetical protein CONLIGDRAFT_672122 [Coniochaeta ligniaria NRRL 30616]|uniref:Uncharacterized protein n=1 Tax=Coniochaeta ligniaria NRRL 30616 TaxID=1408157 RepID=A0A1J7IGK9_9PEZI|nr:hypothetical protein CONLIGDRAFT_672122 [Coniochaeta ligniaria NRRL 30616]